MWVASVDTGTSSSQGVTAANANIGLWNFGSRTTGSGARNPALTLAMEGTAAWRGLIRGYRGMTGMWDNQITTQYGQHVPISVKITVSFPFAKRVLQIVGLI